MKLITSILSSLLLLSSLSYAQNNVIPSTLATGMAVVPNDKEYYKHSNSKVQIIYTKDNLPFAKHTAMVEDSLHEDYEKFFDWELDETLYVGLISSHNQIANGFSTQWPNNRQINYVGGTQYVDYFTTTSWLDTLLYHETAHNYQVNVKGSSASQALHSVIGNGYFIVPFLPLTVPNVLENSFMLEGNAVLNESWHGNGGRLYSGILKAQTILQAKAGNIIPGDVYNRKIAFPYGEIVYIQGGFYNLYMAKKHGIKKVNSYFKIKSEDFVWPQYTDYSMEKATGEDFTTSLGAFAKEYAAKELVLAEGEHLLSSQFFSSLNSNAGEIFFITNETGVRAPELIVMDKKTQKIKKARDSWMAGKVVKIDDEYYTQGSKNTSPTMIHQGLFCNETFIKKGTESKMVQGYLSSGEAVYFDVPSSYSQPQLYVGDKFYAQVNSSVVIDKEDNLYYFIQKEKTRTLYKNKTPLYSFQSFYGMVSDVDSNGAIYFIANSKNGSTLYKYDNKKVIRVSSADNIREARLINDSEVLLAAISDKEYYYVKNSIQSIDESPYEVKLFFEDKEYYKKDGYASKKKSQDIPNIDTSDDYTSIFDMHYSGSDFMIGLSSEEDSKEIVGMLNINFGDPLSQNSANLFITRDESNVTIAGAGYENTQYLLQYSISAYGVVDDDDRANTRSHGMILQAVLPFLQTGYYSGKLSASYFQDYDTLEREPLTVALGLSRSEYYGTSMFVNCLNSLVLYGVSERSDGIVGGSYDFRHDLPAEFYFGVGAQYSESGEDMLQTKATSETRGVKVTEVSDMITGDKDLSKIVMPSINSSNYMKSAGYGEVSLAKVLNFPAYFFTFPISLQREAIYAKYRYYELEDYDAKKYEVNEATVGLTLSAVFLNSFTIPITLEYIYNDADKTLVTDESKVRFMLGASF